VSFHMEFYCRQMTRCGGRLDVGERELGGGWVAVGLAGIESDLFLAGQDVPRTWRKKMPYSFISPFTPNRVLYKPCSLNYRFFFCSFLDKSCLSSCISFFFTYFPV